MNSEFQTLSDIAGPWRDPDFESGLIARCRDAWDKPLNTLSNQELATCLRQRLAIDYLVPIAKRRIKDQIEDDSEIYDGELEEAIRYAQSS